MKRRERRDAEVRREEKIPLRPSASPLPPWSRPPRRFFLGVLILSLAWISLPLLAQDCNLNGVDDAADIKAGVSEDCNANGVPDACDVVPLTFGTLGDPLARAEVFPAMVTRMIGVGEKTGALEIMLMKIADFYDSEVRAMVDALTSLIEPLLIGLMGLVVGGIVIALFLPIIKLPTLINQ